MKWFGRSTTEEVEAVEPPQADAPPAEEGVRWSRSAAWQKRAVTTGVWALLLAGPVSLGLGAAGVFDEPVTQAAPVATEAEDSDRDRAGEFGLRVVTAWLVSTREAPHPDLALVPAFTAPEKAPAVKDLAVAAVEPGRSGTTWSVTVAATVGTGEDAARRYFQVPVQLREEPAAAVAVTLPGDVPGPRAAAAPALDYRVRVGAEDPLSVAAGDFLDALIAGGPDTTRVVSPGVVIPQVSPAPYSAVSVREVLLNREVADAPEDGDTVGVLVTAALTSAETGHRSSGQWALTMTARDQRWEVSALEPTPQTTVDKTSPVPTPGAGTPSASSTPR